MDDEYDDPFENWPRFMVEGMGAEWDPSGDGRWVQVVLMPSFEPDLAISVLEHASICRLRASTSQCNHLDRYLMQMRGEALPPEVPATVLFEQVLASDDAERVWDAARPAVPVQKRLGLDGISVIIRHRISDGGAVLVDSWCPSPGSPERDLVDLLLELIDREGDPSASLIVEQVRRYLN